MEIIKRMQITENVVEELKKENNAIKEDIATIKGKST